MAEIELTCGSLDDGTVELETADAPVLVANACRNLGGDFPAGGSGIISQPLFVEDSGLTAIAAITCRCFFGSSCSSRPSAA
jgi:hypothetical protein